MIAVGIFMTALISGKPAPVKSFCEAVDSACCIHATADTVHLL
jgi:hypothetical protein